MATSLSIGRRWTTWQTGAGKTFLSMWIRPKRLLWILGGGGIPHHLSSSEELRSRWYRHSNTWGIHISSDLYQHCYQPQEGSPAPAEVLLQEAEAGWPQSCCPHLLLQVCGGEHTDILHHCLVTVMLCSAADKAAM